MRDNLIRMCEAAPRPPVTMSPLPTLCLHQLAVGERATVAGVVSASAEIDAVALRRLGELGFPARRAGASCCGAARAGASRSPC
jgi:hypothetical protein